MTAENNIRAGLPLSHNNPPEKKKRKEKSGNGFLTKFQIACVDCGEVDMRFQDTKRCKPCKKKNRSIKDAIYYQNKKAKNA